MDTSPARRPFPRGALFGAALLVGFTIVAAATARLTGVGTAPTPMPAPAESYDLRFEDRADGAVAVRVAGRDRVVAVLEPGTNGFARGVLRALARGRRIREIGTQDAFRLTRSVEGGLVLEDPSTGQRIGLEAFGPTNKEAFMRLLLAARGGAR